MPDKVENWCKTTGQHTMLNFETSAKDATNVEAAF